MTSARISRVWGTILLTIIIFSLSLPAYAKYSGGRGEPNDPYQIATAEDLMLLGETLEDYDKHFIMTADIDLNPNLPGRKVFDRAVIAPDVNDATLWFDGSYFAGVFDGNGQTISNLTITGTNYLGLFGKLRFGAEVKNLDLVDVNITGLGWYVAGLAGSNGDTWSLEGGVITKCSSTGVVSSTSTWVGGLVAYNNGILTSCFSGVRVHSTGGSVGGLVGQNEGNIMDCYSIGAVRGRDYIGGLVGSNYSLVTKCYSTGVVDGNEMIGGLVGSNGNPFYLSYPGTIALCYSSGAVSGKGLVGGLVGSSHSGSITNCYSTGAVNSSYSVGGLVGTNTYSIVTHCYSIGVIEGDRAAGGLVGDNKGVTLHSVWDVQTSGLSNDARGVGLTTDEMMDPYMLGLNGFAEDPNWVLDAGRDYPRLAWEGTAGTIIPEPQIQWLRGTGKTEDPYWVDTADQFILLSRASTLWDKKFILGSNIDLDPTLPGRPIFRQAPIQVFTGAFDGNNHTISDLTIVGGSYLGLFGQLGSGVEVRNLGLLDVNITGSGQCIGGLVGSNSLYHDNKGGTKGGTVAHCHSTGSVSGTGSVVGGLVGLNDGNLIQCYSTCVVSGISSVGGLVGHVGSNTNRYGTIDTSYSSGLVSARENVGGLVGYNNSRGKVRQCSSSTNVSGDNNVGGLVGRNGGEVSNCYSTNTVSGDGSVGGLIGMNWIPWWRGARARGRVVQCYSSGAVSGSEKVGGLVGDNADSLEEFTSSFWDIQTSGQNTSDGGEGKTTSEMQMASTFLDAGWDFVGETENSTEDIWWINEGQDYPRLWWEAHD